MSIKRIVRTIFPASLWTRRFGVAFAGSLATVLCFELLFSMATSFRGLGFGQTYLYALMFALIQAFPAVVTRGRWLQGVVLVAADLLALANLMYARTYYMPIPPASYLLAGNVAEFGDAIVHSLRVYDLSFVLITGLTLWQMRPGRVSGRAYAATLGAGVLICFVVALLGRGPLSHIAWLKSQCYYRATPPVVYTLPVSVLADALESNRPVTEAEKASALAFVKRQRQLTAGTAADSLRYRPKSVVFILVESLEAWTLGARVEGQEITPSLNRLTADTSTTFVARRVLSQVGPGRSIDGQLLMTAGLRPMDDYVYSMRFPESNYPHLAKELRADRGARSYLLSGDRATTWNQGAMARQFGIDVTRFRDSWDSSESFGHPRNPSDASFLRQVREAMQRGDIWPAGETAMVEVITYSSHFPFTIPEEYRHIKLKEKYPEHLAEYITAINYTDRALGEFVDYVLSRPDAASTMIVIVGDHEALATWRDDIRAYSPETARLVDADSYVPMIVLNAPVAGRREAVMGQVDVYPTVLAMAGIAPWRARFGGLGFAAVGSSPSPRYATDISGKIYGDTVGSDRAVMRQVTGASAVSSALIRATLLKP